jgi:predicted DNA-binding protein with PD1-like motif
VEGKPGGQKESRSTEMRDKDGHLHGGHLVRGENPVLITCEVVLAQLQGIDIIRAHDPETNYTVFLLKKGVKT